MFRFLIWWCSTHCVLYLLYPRGQKYITNRYKGVYLHILKRKNIYHMYLHVLQSKFHICHISCFIQGNVTLCIEYMPTTISKLFSIHFATNIVHAPHYTKQAFFLCYIVINEMVIKYKSIYIDWRVKLYWK